MAKAATLKTGTVLADKYIVKKVLLYNNNSITYDAKLIATNERVAIREYMPSDLVVRFEGEEDVIIENKGDKRQRFDAGVNEFIAEAKMLAKNKTIDGLLRVKDCFKTNNTVYMATEPFEGRNITTYVSEEGYMSYDEAEDKFIDIIVLLKNLMTMGIYHNSITPDRILLMNDGSYRIIEFSASEIVEGFSPEEKYYRNIKNQESSVIYSLAATMYYAVSGVLPIGARDRARNDELKSPKSYNRKMKRSDANAILNAMSVKLQTRTATLEDFQRELLMNNVAIVKEKTEKKPLHIGKIIKAVVLLMILISIIVVIVLINQGIIKIKLPQFINTKNNEQTTTAAQSIVEVDSLVFVNGDVEIELAPSSISISESSIVLENVSATKNLSVTVNSYKPNTAELKLIINPPNANVTNANIKYSTSDASVAEVKDGKIFGYKAGEATITATSSNGKKATAKVTVIENSTFTWKSTNSTVAGVSSGVVTALSKGNTVVTCVSNADSTITAQCDVLVGKVAAPNVITSSAANADGIKVNVDWATSAYERYDNSNPVIHNGAGTAAPSNGNSQWATGSWYNGMSTLGGTVFEIKNMAEINDYIKSLSPSAKIKSIEIVATRKDSGGNEQANVKLYSTIKTAANYVSEGSVTTYYGATELEAKSWLRGEEWVYVIKEKADIEKLVNGSTKGFMYYGWGQGGYSIISGFEIRINYTVE
ncbi:MAG: hypothetical protein IKL73_05130 [Lachnospiraceae bacterium]|nr:hypothetical protein [Lachnospiraceae bacterium]